LIPLSWRQQSRRSWMCQRTWRCGEQGSRRREAEQRSAVTSCQRLAKDELRALRGCSSMPQQTRQRQAEGDRGGGDRASLCDGGGGGGGRGSGRSSKQSLRTMSSHEQSKEHPSEMRAAAHEGSWAMSVDADPQVRRGAPTPEGCRRRMGAAMQRGQLYSKPRALPRQRMA